MKMKGWLRERVLRICDYKHLDLVMGWPVVIFAVLIVASEMVLPVNVSVDIVRITFVTILINQGFLNCIDAIRMHDKAVVEKNKLTDIVLSSETVWNWILLCGLYILASFCIFERSEPNFKSRFICLAIIVAISLIFSRLFANVFRKRLVE